MRELFAVLLEEALDAKPVDQELDPRLGPLDPVRVTVVEGDDGLHHHQELALLDERFDHDRLVRLVAQSAAGKNLEPEPIAVPHRDDREVVQEPLRTIGFAAGKTDLELARKLLVQRIAQKVPDRAVHETRDVDVLLRANARERARGDVADGVATGFTSREAEGSKRTERGRRFRERDIIDLQVLTRGDVSHTILREPLDDVGGAAQLPGRQPPARHLDADHVNAFLPLTVHPHLQPHGGELVGVHAAIEEARDRCPELVDLLDVGKILRQRHSAILLVLGHRESATREFKREVAICPRAFLARGLPPPQVDLRSYQRHHFGLKNI